MAQVLPVILAVATAAYSGISSHQQQVSANQKARKQRAAWAAMSKPDPAALEAAAVQNRGQLAQQKLGAYQNLSSSLAARGFGSGSGLGLRGGAGIEKGYLQALGNQATELTKFGLTPQFGPPAGAFGPTGGTTGIGAATNTGANLLGSAYGWTMMQNLLGGQQGITNYYDQTNPYSPYYYEGR